MSDETEVQEVEEAQAVATQEQPKKIKLTPQSGGSVEVSENGAS